MRLLSFTRAAPLRVLSAVLMVAAVFVVAPPQSVEASHNVYCPSDHTSGYRVTMYNLHRESDPDSIGTTRARQIARTASDQWAEVSRGTGQRIRYDCSEGLKLFDDPAAPDSISTYFDVRDRVLTGPHGGFFGTNEKYLVVVFASFDHPDGHQGQAEVGASINGMPDRAVVAVVYRGGWKKAFNSLSKSAKHFAHEMVHNMGGVQPDAPNSAFPFGGGEHSSDGQCNTGTGKCDLMTSFAGPATDHKCGGKPDYFLDCGRNNYWTNSYSAPNAAWLSANRCFNTAASRFLTNISETPKSDCSAQ